MDSCCPQRTRKGSRNRKLIYDGFDKFGQIEDHRWTDYGPNPTVDVDQIKYGYDNVGNRKWREDIVAASNSVNQDELYSYDGANRLATTDRGDLNGAHTTISSKNLAQDWSLDPLGNWSTFKDDADGNGWDFTQTRTHNEANELGTIFNWANPAHDVAGNMTTIPKPNDLANGYTAKYDAWNRLVEVKDGATVVQVNEYDGLNRRTIRDETGDTIHYYYNNQLSLARIPYALSSKHLGHLPRYLRSS